MNPQVKSEICGKCKNLLVHQFPRDKRNFHYVYCGMIKSGSWNGKIGLMAHEEYLAKSKQGYFRACYHTNIPDNCVYYLEYVVGGEKNATKES